MIKFMLRGMTFGAGILLLFLMFLVIAGVTEIATKPPTPQTQVETNHTLTLLAATPEGAKVYRVDGPKVVVPLVMVVGRDGGVAVR